MLALNIASISPELLLLIIAQVNPALLILIISSFNSALLTLMIVTVNSALLIYLYTSVCNLLNLLFFPFFFQYKARISVFFAPYKWEMCSKLTIKIPEYVKLTINLKKGHRWRRSSLFIINFEYVSLFVAVFLLLTSIS